MRDTVEEPTSTAIRERGGLGTEEAERKKEEACVLFTELYSKTGDQLCATHDHCLYIHIIYIILHKRSIEYI